jgi:cytochrome b561
MTLRNTTTTDFPADRYGALSVGLHWFMLLLLVAVYACIELRELFPKGSEPREALKAWHFMLGLSVLSLVGLRLVARVMQPAPRIEPDPSTSQKLLAKLMHVMLYVLMIGMPIAGWLLLSASSSASMQLPPCSTTTSNETTRCAACSRTGSEICRPPDPAIEAGQGADAVETQNRPMRRACRASPSLSLHREQ